LGGHKSGPDILEKPLPGFESRLPGQEPSHNTDWATSVHRKSALTYVCSGKQWDVKVASKEKIQWTEGNTTGLWKGDETADSINGLEKFWVVELL